MTEYVIIAGGDAGPPGPAGGALDYPVLAPDGSAAAPTYSFEDWPDSGMWYDGASEVLVVSADGGVSRLELGDDINLVTTGELQVNGAPGTAGQVLTSNGAGAPPTWEDPAGGGGVTYPLQAPNGSLILPSFSFENADDSGLWYDAAGTAMKLSAEGGASLVALDENARLESSEAFVILHGGTSVPGTACGIQIHTNGVERLRIGSQGAWNLNQEGAGTVGQVLTSNGSSTPPSWENAAGGGVTFPLLAPNGGLLAPSYSFSNSTQSGLHFDGSNTVFAHVGGIASLFLGSNVALQSTTGDISLNALTNVLIAPQQGIEFITDGGTTRLLIQQTGAWAIGGSVGTAGQVITSNGAGTPPTWQAAPAPTVQMSIDVDGSGLKLENDVESPGPLYFYGTDSDEVKGWFQIGTGGTSLQSSWKFDSNTTAVDPGLKDFRMNSATLASVTELYLDDTTIPGTIIDTLAGFLVAGMRIYIQQKNDATRAALFEITGAGTNNTGWWTIPVSVINSATIFQNSADCVFSFALQTKDPTFPLLAPNGTAGAPSYSFTNSSDSGLYYTGTAVRLTDDADGDYIEVGASINIVSNASDVTIDAGSGTFYGFGDIALIEGVTSTDVTCTGATTVSGGTSTTVSGGTIAISSSSAVTITGSGPSSSGNVTITAGNASTAGTGSTLALAAGNGGSSGGTGGSTTYSAGNGGGSSAGGTVTISGGSGGSTAGAGGAVTVRGGTATDGNGGSVTIQGRNAVGTDRIGGGAALTAGNATGTGLAGSVSLTAGTSPSGTDGSIVFTTDGTERLEILGSGGWEVGGSQGTATHVLTSNGAGTPPTWQAVSGSGVSEPDTQIVYGTGSAVDSSSALIYATTTGAFTLNPGTKAAPANITMTAAGSSTAATAGAAVNITAGAGNTSGLGGAIGLTGGSGGASAAGGAATVEGGPGGGTSGNGGAVTIRGGVPTDGDGGAVTVAGRNGVGTNRSGGDANLTAGNASQAGTGGAATVTAGSGGVSGTAGAANLVGGAGGSTSGAGGAVLITGGLPVDGNGGGVTLSGRGAAGTSRTGGSVSITGGGSTTAVTGGTITMTGGAGGATGAGGSVTISGGAGGSTSGTGGAVTLRGGTASDGNGGAANLTGRNGIGTNRTGGAVSVTAGDATGSGAGGAVNITGGDSSGGTPGTIFFNTAVTERMKIGPTGLVGIGTTTAPTAVGSLAVTNASTSAIACDFLNSAASGTRTTLRLRYSGSAPDDNSSIFLLANDNSTDRVIIYSDGDIQNHDNSYGAISDERLKQDIADASSQWNDVKALRLRKYRFKSDVAAYGSQAVTHIGLVAQEVLAISPGLVTHDDSPDASGFFGLQYSLLHLKAFGALQEAMKRIEALEAEVAALKAKLP